MNAIYVHPRTCAHHNDKHVDYALVRLLFQLGKGEGDKGFPIRHLSDDIEGACLVKKTMLDSLYLEIAWCIDFEHLMNCCLN